MGHALMTSRVDTKMTLLKRNHKAVISGGHILVRSTIDIIVAVVSMWIWMNHWVYRRGEEGRMLCAQP